MEIAASSSLKNLLEGAQGVPARRNRVYPHGASEWDDLKKHGASPVPDKMTQKEVDARSHDRRRVGVPKKRIVSISQ